MSEETPREEQPGGEAEEPAGHWRLMGDLLALQFKLAVDGIRDLLLSPVSIGAAIYGVFASPENPGKYFNEVLKLGHRSDRWINLFGASQHYEAGEHSTDVYVRKVEDLIVSQYNKGGALKSIKEGTDNLLRKVHKDRDQNRDEDQE